MPFWGGKTKNFILSQLYGDYSSRMNRRQPVGFIIPQMFGIFPSNVLLTGAAPIEKNSKGTISHQESVPFCGLVVKAGQLPLPNSADIPQCLCVDQLDAPVPQLDEPLAFEVTQNGAHSLTICAKAIGKGLMAHTLDDATLLNV